MPRPLLIRSQIHPYHVTSRTRGKQFFSIPLQDVWVIMMEQLKLEIKDHGLGVHAFVLMGNHFHLLCHTPKGNLDQVMQRFLRSISIEISLKKGVRECLWEGRYKWSLINSHSHYFQVYRYIYQNPIRAQICTKVEDYPFTTLVREDIPIHSAVPFCFGGTEGELRWLNEKFEKNEEDLIRLGLRKSQFDVSKRNLKEFKRLIRPR